MTLTQLRYVVAIDNYKSFASAARHCLVAQPTLSLQIQKFEQEIGIEIFDRRKSPVVATGPGQEIIKQARKVLEEAEKLAELFKESDEEPSGEIHLAIIPTISTYLMPVIFRTFQLKYPRIDLRIFELPTSQIIEKLERGEVDLGILATPLQNKDIMEIPVYYEPFVLYFPPEYEGPLENLQVEDISYDWILLGEEHCFRHQSLQVCGKHSTSRIECGSIETVRKMVDLGAGMTLLPALSFPDSEQHRINSRSQIGSFAAPEPAREISIVHRKSYYKKKILSALQNCILEYVPADYHHKQNRKIMGVQA